MEGIETQASSSRKEIKFDLSESFEITTDNKIYELKISYNEQLMFFEIKEKNAFLKDEFNLYTNLKELGDINRFFNQFETIKQVFNTIKKLINKKNISIIQEEKKMKIKIINPIDDEEFFINVNSKEKDTKSEINSIIACVNSLTQKVQNLENKLNELYAYKDDIEEIIKEKKKKKELYEKYQIYKSSVINKDEIDLFMNWFDKKPTKIKLLLDSKIDGDSTQTFYNKCSNKFPTVVFVKTTKGRRFGGYCSIGWENTNGSFKKDINNFIFSLDKKKKYKIKKPENGICTSSGFFAFGSGCDFCIHNNCTSNNNYNNNSGTYETTEQYELNGERDYTVSSYEVYQIEY